MPSRAWGKGTPPRPGRARSAARRRRIEPRCAAGRRRALTLIELLLVVALLAVIASLAAPILTGSFQNVRLRRGADQILSAWSQTRKAAIESGEVHQFRFVPETGRYWTARWLGDELPVEETADGTASTNQPATTVAPRRVTSSAAPSGREEEAAVSGLREGALPDEVTFHAGQMVVDDPLAGERRVDAMLARGAEESTPILFFPDGTTSEASLVLTNAGKRYLRVSLRGLTGVGRTSDLMTSEELDRLSDRR